MAYFEKLNASVEKLRTDVDALIASQANVQPAIDAAQAALDMVDATVLNATPPSA